MVSFTKDFMENFMKRRAAIKMAKVIMLLIAVCCVLSACTSSKEMPFNGKIQFHEICLEIPKNFVRDSTQSKEDLWVYEHHNYASYILLLYKDASGVQNPEEELASYGEYICGQGGSVVETGSASFNEDDVPYIILSYITNDDKEGREFYFFYNDSFYSVALRGGSEEEFVTLYESIGVPGEE